MSASRLFRPTGHLSLRSVPIALHLEDSLRNTSRGTLHVCLSDQLVHDAEEKTSFLNREVQYTQQLYGVLKTIQKINHVFDDVEKAKDERRILDSLRLLERE